MLEGTLILCGEEVPGYRGMGQSEMRQRRQLLVAHPLSSRNQQNRRRRDDPCLAPSVRLKLK